MSSSTGPVFDEEPATAQDLENEDFQDSEAEYEDEIQHSLTQLSMNDTQPEQVRPPSPAFMLNQSSEWYTTSDFSAANNTTTDVPESEKESQPVDRRSGKQRQERSRH